VKQRTFTLLGFGPKTRISMQETTAKWELKIMLAMEVPDRQTLLKSHLAFLTFAQRILAALCASSRRDLAVLVRSCFARISCPHLLEFRQRIHFQRLRRRSRFSSMRARFSSSMMSAYAKVDAKGRFRSAEAARSHRARQSWIRVSACGAVPSVSAPTASEWEAISPCCRCRRPPSHMRAEFRPR
jgi:hypothetical protein